MHEFTQKIENVSKKRYTEYMDFFEIIRNLLIKNFMEKKSDLKEWLELISKYSQNSTVKNLSTNERLYLL